MLKRKKHVISGLFSLILSIVMPTFIYQYYFSATPLSDLLKQSEFSGDMSELISLFTIILIWLVCLFYAFRELGGYLVSLADYKDENEEEYLV